jgi:hypothetical protein
MALKMEEIVASESPVNKAKAGVALASQTFWEKIIM